MKSKHSSSLILVWRVAEFEARHLNASTIEPAHLLLGLCKVVDLDLAAMVPKNSLARDELLEELLREIRRLRTVFQVAGLDARTFRRLLRRASPDRRFSLEESDRLRRSIAAKRVFADAEHFAQLGNSMVYPVHLLYATLLGDDEHRDAAMANLNIDKKRLLTVAKRAILTVQADTLSVSRGEPPTWN